MKINSFQKAICYFHDNMLFFTRTKLLRFDESKVARRYYSSWCGADLFYLIGLFLQLKAHLARLKSLKLKQKSFIQRSSIINVPDSSLDGISVYLLSNIYYFFTLKCISPLIGSYKTSEFNDEYLGGNTLSEIEGQIVTINTKLRWIILRIIKVLN